MYIPQLKKFSTVNTNFQPIIAKSRECGLVTWHVVVGNVSEKNPAPVTKMYWDDKKGISLKKI